MDPLKSHVLGVWSYFPLCFFWWYHFPLNLICFYTYLIVVTSTTSGAGVKIFRLVSKKCEIKCFGVKIMNFVFFVVKKCFWCLLKMVLVSKTSQELRMLSSVTINCQVRMIDWIQVLNCQNCNQCLKCQVSRTVFPIVKNCFNVIRYCHQNLSSKICHQKLLWRIVIKNCHQELSSRIVIKNCHQESSSKIFIKNCLQKLSSKIVLKNCHQKLSSKIVIKNCLQKLSWKCLKGQKSLGSL